MTLVVIENSSCLIFFIVTKFVEKFQLETKRGKDIILRLQSFLICNKFTFQSKRMIFFMSERLLYTVYFVGVRAGKRDFRVFFRLVLLQVYKPQQ